MLSRVIKSLRLFHSETNGNLTVIFALALIPMVGAVGAAVDYSQANSMKSSMQAATDAAALGLVSQAATLTSTQISSTANSYFLANFNRPNATSVTVSASYNSQTTTLTINASANSSTTFLAAMGIHNVSVTTRSAATMAAKSWPICVMVTDPTSSHTLRTDNTAQINFNNCMVQVNTDNWDAVEAASTSSITSTNGDNCFVGDIHFGNITPPKDPTCRMFPDPFAAYTMPASASTCNYGWIGPGAPHGQPPAMNVTANNTTLSPGTYCQGLTANNVSNVTFNPGVYIINGGLLKIQGPAGYTNVTAPGVTFLLMGQNAGLNLQKVNFNITPDTTNAGNFNGFLFFLDQSSCSSGNCSYGNQSTFDNVTMNTSGIVYLVGQQMQIKNASNITLNTGSIIAGFILPVNTSTLNVTGQLNTGSTAQIALQKAGASGTNPLLIQ